MKYHTMILFRSDRVQYNRTSKYFIYVAGCSRIFFIIFLFIKTDIKSSKNEDYFILFKTIRDDWSFTKIFIENIT